MTVVPFQPRVPAPAHTLEELVARKRSPHPSCDLAVTKGARTRRYVVWSDAPGRFVGEVWFDQCLHRHRHVAGVHDARLLGMQFARELADLLANGWTAS